MARRTIDIRKPALLRTAALRFALAGLAAAGVASVAGTPALAQGQGSPGAGVTTQAPTAPQQPLLKAEEVEALVSPIALYPDNLLAEVLMASTYPLEVVEADRWVKQNKALKGDALVQAADKQQWDESIKSLTAVPDVLGMMSSQLEWTQKLGDAVLAQQADIMNAVQRLRQRAQANNQLQTTAQQKVTVTRAADKQSIAIEPAEPNTLYVPYYQPAVVYGGWPYPDDPPYYFTPPGYIAGVAIATGVAFAAGVAVGAWASRPGWWGGGFAWNDRIINIRNTDININTRNTWVHNPDHRHGVRYSNAAVRQQFAKHDGVGGADRRMDFRGHDGKQVLRPDADRTVGRGSDLGKRDGNLRDRDDAKRLDGGRRDDLKRAGDRAKSAKHAGGGAHGAARPAARERPQPHVRPGGGHEGAFAHMDRGAFEHAGALRGHASFGGRGGGFHGGGGGFRGGGHGGFRR